MGHADAQNYLETEVLTMRYLKKKGLPVAEVYAFDTSLNSPLSCPFILMEYLPGRPSYEGKYFFLCMDLYAPASTIDAPQLPRVVVLDLYKLWLIESRC